MRNLRKASNKLCVLGCLVLSTHAWAQYSPHVVTIPMQLELERPYIDVMLTGPGGKAVRAHAWVDTGGGAILLSAELAQRLDLKPGKITHEEGHILAPVNVPGLRIGDMPIGLTQARAFVVTDEPHALDNTDADLALPASVLRNDTVVFNYPRHTFTIAEPGQLHPEGTEVKAYIGQSGMPVIWLTVASQTHGFLLDTGGQFCMISFANIIDWMKQRPAWVHVHGAYGPGNMLLQGDSKEEMLRIGEMDWGSFQIKNAGTVSRPVGAYEKWMSDMVDKPIIGSIGGNVLRDFRVTIDYPSGKIYLQHQKSQQNPTLDMVKVTLVNAPQGGYEIAGAAGGVRDIMPGDRLVKIDDQQVSELPYYRVADLLSGKSGKAHKLALIREGKSLTVKARVRSVF